MLTREFVDKWLNEPLQCLHGTDLNESDRKRIKTIYFSKHGSKTIGALAIIIVMTLIELLIIQMADNDYTIAPNGSISLMIEIIILFFAIIVSSIYIKNNLIEASDILLGNYICKVYSLEKKTVEDNIEGSKTYYMHLDGHKYEAIDVADYSEASIGELCYLIYIKYEPAFVARAINYVQYKSDINAYNALDI